MRDPELAAIEAAYRTLRGMDAKQWMRALAYIANRLSEDDRTVSVMMNQENLGPSWFIQGDTQDVVYPDKHQVVVEVGEYMEPVEVCGVAVVSQEWAVLVPIGDQNGDPDGEEVMWFATRAGAISYVERVGKDRPEAPPA